MSDLRPRRGVAVAALAVAVVALSCSTLALSAGASGSVDSHVEIEEYVVQTTRGDLAEFTLSVPRGESATLVVDGADGYRTELDLGDASGDGRIAVTANTYRARPNATASEVYSVSDGDTLATDGTEGRLPAAVYRVEAYGNGTGGAPADTVEFEVTQTGLGNATVMVAPADTGDRFGSMAGIERARDEGWLTPGSTVAAGDTVLLRLRLSGIEGGVVDAGGVADARAFRRYLDRPDVRLALVERYPGPSRARQRLLLNGSSFESVVADPANGTYYVAVGLDEIPHAHDEIPYSHDDESERFDHGVRFGEFAPRFVVGGEARLNPWETDDPLFESARYGPNVTGVFELTEREARPSGVDRESGNGSLRPGFAAAPNQTVTGYTSLAPGSTLTVTASNASGVERSVNATARVTRETDRPSEYDPPMFVFEGALNLTGVEPGTVRLRIRSNGTVLSEYGPQPRHYDARVDSAEAAVELSADPMDDGTVRVDRATLPDGGFVAVERTTDGAVVGNTGYLDPGTHENLRVVLEDTSSNASSQLRAVLVRDSDGDGSFDVDADDRPYADAMRTVGTTVSRTPVSTATATETTTPAPTTSPTATPSPTPHDPSTAPPPSTVTPHVDPGTTPTPQSTTDPSSTARPTATSGDGPGFGALAALLGALALAALGVRRSGRRAR